MAGDILATASAAPGTPAAGKGRVWYDSTAKNWMSVSDGGQVKHGIKSRSSTASRWIDAILDDGSTTTSQPAFIDIIGSVINSQLATMPTLTIKGNNTGGASTPLDLTVAQVNAILPVFTSVLNGSTPLSGGGTTNFLRADGTWAAPPSAGGGITQLTGDVTAGPGSGSQAATLANIPNDVPMAGDLLATAIAAPTSPAAGKGRIYVDSTSLNLAVKNSSGTVNHGIQSRGATASNWLRSIADDGSSTISQPGFSDITGTVTLSQLGSGSALSVLGVQGNSPGSRADISASASSGQVLRESSGTIGWGAIATAGYGNNTVTYAKIQATAAGSVLLGRGNSGAGNVQEISLTGNLSISGTVLNSPTEFSLTFGGNLPSVGTTFPIFLGVGDSSWSTSGSIGMIAPNGSTAQDWSFYVMSNSLTGTAGVMSVDWYQNGVFRGSLGTIGIGSTGAALKSTAQSIGAGDIIGIRLSTNSGTITGGSLWLYVVGRFG